MTNAFRGVLTRTFQTEDVYDDQGIRVELGREKTYRFVMDFNAIAVIEEITGRGMFDLFARMNAGIISAGELRALYYGISLRYQPNISIEEAGDLIEALPELWTEVYKAGFPQLAKTSTESKPETNGKKTERKTKTRS